MFQLVGERDLMGVFLGCCHCDVVSNLREMVMMADGRSCSCWERVDLCMERERERLDGCYAGDEASVVQCLDQRYSR